MNVQACETSKNVFLKGGAQIYAGGKIKINVPT
jgi:hypothetical protein